MLEKKLLYQHWPLKTRNFWKSTADYIRIVIRELIYQDLLFYFVIYIPRQEEVFP